MRSIFGLSLLLISVGLLSACQSLQKSSVNDAQYWQRASASDAIYQRGPKAQQMLNQDIANCVVEVRELVRLGALRQSVNDGTSGHIEDQDRRELAKWDEPVRDRYMLTEHKNYNDFEGCMMAGGWERVKHVPYNVAKDSRQNYLRSHVDYKYKSRNPDATTQDANNTGLNE